jgi:ribonuclease HII
MITNNYEIGVDEAGRGPLIGRVYSSAVYLGNSIPPKDIIITDSKKMTRIQRQKAYEWIINNAKDYSIAFSEPNEIDNINILQATRLAMNRALSSIKESNLYDANTIVIDGPRWENKFDEFKKYNLQIKSVIGGDSKHLSIAAASIIAKEEHDKYIKELCLQNEDLNDKYDLLNNMGYGTKKHLEGIKKYGISPFHRKSFKPCKL